MINIIGYLFKMINQDKTLIAYSKLLKSKVVATKVRPGANAIKKFTPSLGIPYL